MCYASVSVSHAGPGLPSPTNTAALKRFVLVSCQTLLSFMFSAPLHRSQVSRKSSRSPLFLETIAPAVLRIVLSLVPRGVVDLLFSPAGEPFFRCCCFRRVWSGEREDLMMFLWFYYGRIRCSEIFILFWFPTLLLKNISCRFYCPQFMTVSVSLYFIPTSFLLTSAEITSVLSL